MTDRGNPMWTSADLERMDERQIARLTRAGELDHLLAGDEPSQKIADQLKQEALLEMAERDEAE